MENLKGNISDLKKEWVAPELKMVDVELVTALNTATTDDTDGTS